jgi:hypothetical protein
MTDWMLVIFTALVAIFTGSLWWTTWKDTRILQRAYIAVEPLGIHLMANGSSLIGHVGTKNAGHLPARKLNWLISIKHSLNGAEPESFFPLEKGNGKIVVAPGTVATQATNTNVSVQTLLTECAAEAAKGERALEIDVFLYVWGAVRYDDGFKRTRSTKFCHRYNWKTRDGRYEIAARDARYHDHGNDAD